MFARDNTIQSGKLGLFQSWAEIPANFVEKLLDTVTKNPERRLGINAKTGCPAVSAKL